MVNLDEVHVEGVPLAVFGPGLQMLSFGPAGLLSVPVTPGVLLLSETVATHRLEPTGRLLGEGL